MPRSTCRLWFSLLCYLMHDHYTYHFILINSDLIKRGALAATYSFNLSHISLSDSLIEQSKESIHFMIWFSQTGKFFISFPSLGLYWLIYIKAKGSGRNKTINVEINVFLNIFCLQELIVKMKWGDFYSVIDAPSTVSRQCSHLLPSLSISL